MGRSRHCRVSVQAESIYSSSRQRHGTIEYDRLRALHPYVAYNPGMNMNYTVVTFRNPHYARRPPMSRVSHEAGSRVKHSSLTYVKGDVSVKKAQSVRGRKNPRKKLPGIAAREVWANYFFAQWPMKHQFYRQDRVASCAILKTHIRHYKKGRRAVLRSLQ